MPVSRKRKTLHEVTYCRCGKCGHKYDVRQMKPLGRDSMVCGRCILIARAERGLAETAVH